MQPEDFDPCLCTHVLYSFVNLRDNQLQLTETDKGKRMQKLITKKKLFT